MWLRRLEVQGFRCISDAVLELSPGINVIHGRNGSGKTSLLESVYLMGTGRSFRSREPDQAIQEGAAALIVRGDFDDDGTSTVVALQRERGRTTIRRNGEGLRSATELSRTMPMMLVTPDTHVEMLTSPKARRRWLDMTLFHVKPGFLELWKRYMKGIKHRNALLRRGAGAEVLDAWDLPLARVGEELHGLRETIFRDLFEQAQSLLLTTFDNRESVLHYHRGWSADCSLLEAMSRCRDSDSAMGMTRNGPHRADVSFTHAGHPIGQRFSRGQMKVWIGVLMLAQAMVIAQATGAAPVLLVDDFVTDLDAEARKHLLSQLASAGCQLMVTTTDIAAVTLPVDVPAAVFHVKQGAVQRA